MDVARKRRLRQLGFFELLLLAIFCPCSLSLKEYGQVLEAEHARVLLQACGRDFVGSPCNSPGILCDVTACQEQLAEENSRSQSSGSGSRNSSKCVVSIDLEGQQQRVRFASSITFIGWISIPTMTISCKSWSDH